MLNRRTIFLFLWVSSLTTLTLGIGWVIGSVAGGLHSQVFAFAGGSLGAYIGGEIAYRRGLVDAQWGSMVSGGPYMGFLFCGGLAALNELPGLLMALAAIIGSGLGAIAAKYGLEFFNEDPPPSIL